MNVRHSLALVALVASSWLLAARALAYPGGVAASGCNGCHNGGSFDVQLAWALSPETFEPGDQVEATLTITAPGASAAGVYITTQGVGTLAAISGQGLSTRSDGLAHTTPKALSGGRTQFRFTFRAPNGEGAVRLSAYALATNGNGRSSGDSGGQGSFQSAFGCEGQLFYYDADEDGFGRDSLEPTLACQGNPPMAYSAEKGDCRDFDDRAYPGADEVCDTVDNDCDGEVDEDAVPVMLWPDRDGDGYYDVQEGEPVEGCVGLSGYAAEGGDCRGDDPAVHPGAAELCDFQDQDCDGTADEGVKPTCGEGWCRRESSGCDLDQCIPGEPTPETCNYLDDDCDGQIDEDGDALCAAGEHCVEGRCSAEAPAGGDGGSDGDGATSGGGGGEGDGSTSGNGPPASASSGGCTVAGRDAQGPFALALLALVLGRRRASLRRAGRAPTL